MPKIFWPRFQKLVFCSNKLRCGHSWRVECTGCTRHGCCVLYFTCLISVCFRLSYKPTMLGRQACCLHVSPSVSGVRTFHSFRRQNSLIEISSRDHPLQSSVADPYAVFSVTSAVPGVSKLGLQLAEEVSTSYANEICTVKERKLVRSIVFSVRYTNFTQPSRTKVRKDQ
jgi:hypothetical protein